MARAHPIIFVLWGQGFDELIACTFVTNFRRSGIRVKVVGISGSRNRGACGLTLLPDLAVHEALPLASHAMAVVIPCEEYILRRFVEDVQVRSLLEAAAGNRAWLASCQAGLAPWWPWRNELCFVVNRDLDLQRTFLEFREHILTE
jgi:hypothetical protein